MDVRNHRGYKISTERFPDGKWQAVARSGSHHILSNRFILKFNAIQNVKVKIDEYLDEPIIDTQGVTIREGEK